FRQFRRKFFSVLGEKSQAATTGGTSPAISVQRVRKIEVQLRRPSELQVPVAEVAFEDCSTRFVDKRSGETRSFRSYMQY
ncbi:hypothetical protein U1Q18_013145, partial [Sarracenia purpurea var. burkii]